MMNWWYDGNTDELYVYHVRAIRNIRGLHDSVMLDMAHLCFLDNIMITVMKNSTISLK